MSEIAIKAGAERNIQANEPKAEENVKICKQSSFLCEIRRWCRFSQSPDFFHNCNFPTKNQRIYNTASKNLQKRDFNLNFEAIKYERRAESINMHHAKWDSKETETIQKLSVSCRT